MQVTIEITEEEYMQIESHAKRSLMMDQIGMANLTIADKILARICVAVSRRLGKLNKTRRETNEIERS